MSASAVFRKENRQNPNTKTLFQTKDDQRLTVKYLNTVQVGKQKLLEPQSVTPMMVRTKTLGLLHLSLTTNFPSNPVYSPKVS